MKVIDLENVKFSSINNKFNMGNGRLFLNTAYRNFKELIKQAAIKTYIEPPYAVIINIEAYQDIDASIKVILDGLETAGVIDNDKNIYSLVVEKTPVKRGKTGKLQVWVETKEA